MRILILFCVLGAFLRSNAFAENQARSKIVSQLKTYLSTRKTEKCSVAGLPPLSLQYQEKPDKILTVICEYGSVIPLSSLDKSGNVYLSKAGSERVFRFSFIINKLDFNLISCNVKNVHNFTKTGIKGNIGPTSITVEVTLEELSGKCNVTVNSIAVDKVGPIIIERLSGVLVKYNSQILKWIVEHFNSIAPALDKILNKAINHALSRVDMCKLLPDV